MKIVGWPAMHRPSWYGCMRFKLCHVLHLLQTAGLKNFSMRIGCQRLAGDMQTHGLQRLRSRWIFSKHLYWDIAALDLLMHGGVSLIILVNNSFVRIASFAVIKITRNFWKQIVGWRLANVSRMNLGLLNSVSDSMGTTSWKSTEIHSKSPAEISIESLDFWTHLNFGLPGFLISPGYLTHLDFWTHLDCWSHLNLKNHLDLWTHLNFGHT